MEPILDIKVVAIKGFISILAVSPTKLNQFVGQDDGLKPVLDKYKTNPQLRTKHSITIPSRRTNEEVKGLDDHASMNLASGARDNPMEQPKLQLFYSDREEDGCQTRYVAGFGWMNESQFIYGSYEVEDLSASNPNGFEGLIFKKDHLKYITYVKKERGLQPTEIEIPQSFAITMFHIIFMYPTNITVVSKISRQVVYNNNFEK